MTSILSTGKKKQKASRVFGGNFFNEVETSLCYSPSPAPNSFKHATIKEIESSPTPTVLFEMDQNETTKGKRGSFVGDKENTSENSPMTVNISMDKNCSIQSIRNSELSRLRASVQSPQRVDFVKKTQVAINNATTSVNQSLHTEPVKNASASVNQILNASRKAKENDLHERVSKTKTVRFQWDEEKADAKSFYSRVEENRRQILAVQRKLASAHFNAKSKTDDKKKRHHIAQLDQEAQFNSEVFREHQKKQKEQQDKNRKKSIDARMKLRQNKREGEEKLKTMQREEEEAIFDVRYDIHRARNETAKTDTDARRKSFQFRAGDAKRIRGIRSHWRRDDNKEQHESFELKRAAAKDVEVYKKKMDAERRESFKSRNQQSRKQREEEKNRDFAAMRAEHESYELKWSGERDAEANSKRMQEERRKSLAGRNKESARQAKVMEELRTLAQEQNTESFMLKWGGENDIKDDMAKLAEERRKSLQFRGGEARKHREYNDEQRLKAVESALNEAALQSDCQKDVEQYKKECAERRRKSLQFRGKESKVQRLEETTRLQNQYDLGHQNFELESLARTDIEDYVKDCKKRRRKSLAFRAKEKRRHAQWKRQQGEKLIQEQSRTAHFHSLDAQNMALAEQQESARVAMDALRSAGCSIKGNPFEDLMTL